MPLYEYLCETCGPFEQRRDISHATDAVPCPECQVDAPRVFSIPGLYKTSSLERRVRQRAELGAEPRVEQRSSSEHTHSETCHHKHPHQRHASKRPWMLGH